MKPALLILLAAGCSDLGGFAGAWHGRALDGAVRVGVAADAQAALQLDIVERNRVQGALSLGGAAPAPLRALPAASADLLGELSLPDSPLRSYLTVTAVPDGDALSIVSLYDDRVDLRILRADTLYAVFRLSR